MKPIKTGVIGLGVGERHLASYANIPGVEVAAICDVDPAKLAEVGDRNGIARRYQDFRKITEDPDIDVVSVCSYDQFHAEQVISAFNHGKHVMVEKPVVLHPAELEAVVRAQQDSGKQITSNLILRESPRFKALKRMIDAGEFGDIVAIEGDYIHEILWKITEGWRGHQDFYCVTYGGGIHLIDLMRWLVGDEVVEVCGMGNKMLTRDCASFPWPDVLVNLLKFSRGTIGKTMTNFGPKRPHFHALNVFGTQRSFVNDVPAAKLFDGDQPENVHVMDVPYPAYDKGDLLPDFINAIRADRAPVVGARDVFRVMDICFACWKSVEVGAPVKISYTL